MLNNKKKGSQKALVGILIIVVFVLLFIILGGPKVTGNFVRNIGCKQITEYRTEYRIEEYHSSAKNCDSVVGCTCMHKSWLGLGPCDSCRCSKRVSVQVPYTIEKCAWN